MLRAHPAVTRLTVHRGTYYWAERAFAFFLPKAVAEDELCAHDVRVLDISK